MPLCCPLTLSRFWTAPPGLTSRPFHPAGRAHTRSPLAQARFRRSVVLPTLGLLLLYSYAAWVGLPQLLLPLLQPLQHPHDPPGHRPVGPPYPPASELLRLHPTLVAWLGLQGVGPLLVWTLFGTTMLCTRQASANTD